MGRAYLVVEGHGEVAAAGNLVNRLWQDRKLMRAHWAEPIRGIALHTQKGLTKACGLVRGKGDAELLLILRDEDDHCPKDQGPSLAQMVASLQLPFPTAVVMAYREYEVFFLPCLKLMAGKSIVDAFGNQLAGLLPGTHYEGNPESIRGVKEWLTDHMPPGRSYKPTICQLPMTRMIDLQVLRESGLPCFGTLERALVFLSAHRGQPGHVYPQPATPAGD